MAKKILKRRIRAAQGAACALTDVPLSANMGLIDTDRVIAKAAGGIYTDENTRVVDPVAHMERHGTLRTREEELDELKTLVDDRTQVMRLKLKVNNQLLAFERRTDRTNPETSAFLRAQRDSIDLVLRDRTRRVVTAINAFRVHDRLVDCALNVPNFGPITVALLTVYVDLTKARSASSLWKYTGLHAPSHERYTKGETSGGNKTLRCAVWNGACAMMKDIRSPYRDVYDRTRNRLAESERPVQSRNTEGHLVTVPWRETKPGHRHGAALRAIMKHMLADYWTVGRTLLGLPALPLYVEERLGHTRIVQPAARGWRYSEPSNLSQP